MLYRADNQRDRAFYSTEHKETQLTNTENIPTKTEIILKNRLFINKNQKNKLFL